MWDPHTYNDWTDARGRYKKTRLPPIGVRGRTPWGVNVARRPVRAGGLRAEGIGSNGAIGMRAQNPQRHAQPEESLPLTPIGEAGFTCNISL